MEANVANELTAHHANGPEMKIVPAPRSREWMERAKGANRCIPIRIANEAGWWILNPHRFKVAWTGESHELGVVNPETGRPPQISYLKTSFGHGILTILIPYLFRTEPGWNLLARGPSNHPKHGIQALEGLVETDWTTATFTMNWQLTAPDVPVVFEAGEPLCQIVPMKRGDLETFEPQTKKLEGELLQRYSAWVRVRNTHYQPAAQMENIEAVVQKQREHKDAYAKGRFSGDAERFEEHQTRLKLSEFSEKERK